MSAISFSWGNSWTRAPSKGGEGIGFGEELYNVHLLYNSLSRMGKRCHKASSRYKLNGKVGFYRDTVIQKNVIDTFMEQINNKYNYIKINNMCKFQKFEGEITNYANNVYTITVGNKDVTIPYSIMHKYPVFPDSMMEADHLKIGSTIMLVKKDEQTYYPDHETYGIGNCQEHAPNVDGAYLLKDAEPWKMNCSFQEIICKLSNILPEISDKERSVVLQTLANQGMTEDEKLDRITNLVVFPLEFKESATLEKKKSLFFPAKRSKDEFAQPKEIVESIVAMCNCVDQKPCKLVIGVDNKTNKTNRLQDEIASRYPQMYSLDQFQNTFLVPFIKSYTFDNPILMSSLKYNWYNYHGDLVLVIDIDYKGMPIVCKGGILPYRCDSAKMCVEGPDMVNMIAKLINHIE